MRYYYTYNDQGLLIHSECTQSSKSFTADYAYDSNGTLRESKKVTADGTVIHKFYNAAGNLTQLDRYHNDRPVEQLRYTYDAFNRVIAIAGVQPSGYQNLAFSYDLAGRLVKISLDMNENGLDKDIISDDEESFYWYRSYTQYYHYDLQGHLTEIVTEYPTNTVRMDFVYDLYGRLKQYSYVGLYSIQYAYDGNGNILSESHYNTDGTLSSLTTYSYIAVQVTRKEAERLLAQQDTIVDFSFDIYPPDPMPEKEEFYP